MNEWFTNYGMDTVGEKEKRTPKENVNGRSTSNHSFISIQPLGRF